MQIITDIYAISLRRPTALTIGNFDGIHRGHQVLLSELCRVAASLAGNLNSDGAAVTGLMVFDPHPLTVLRPEQEHKLLTTPLERLQLAGRLGIDLGIVQPFTAKTAALEPAEFMGLLKRHLNLAALVVGPDFALGRNRTGNLEVLAALGEQLGYRVVVIEPVEWSNQPVRSSAVRHLLLEGQVEEAAELLGRPYHVSGLVVLGDERGRQLGTPTANLLPPPNKLWPADGVYATRTWLHTGASPLFTAPTVYNSVTNLGVRPTVDGLHRRLETHLLDFPPAGHTGDLYGQTLTVEFIKRLRGEKRFSGLPELVAQIQSDIATARTLLPPPIPESHPFFLEELPA
jgi:riboflavin kinase/FMN adenylyltransferase